MSAAKMACWVLSVLQCVLGVMHFVDGFGVPEGVKPTDFDMHLIGVLGATHMAMGFFLASAAATKGAGMRKCIAGIYGTWYLMCAVVAAYVRPVEGPARYITAAFGALGLITAFGLPDKASSSSAKGTPSRSTRSKSR